MFCIERLHWLLFSMLILRSLPVVAWPDEKGSDLANIQKAVCRRWIPLLPR